MKQPSKMGIIEVSRLCGKCFEIDGKEIPVVGHKCPYYKKNKMEKPKETNGK
jgi:hypothetical protein